METNFLTVIAEEASAPVTTEIYAKNVFGLYGTIMANSRETAKDSVWPANVGKTRPSTDKELFQAWHHSTVERKHGVWATKEPLRKELISRGYVLNEKNRWYKAEAESNFSDEKGVE